MRRPGLGQDVSDHRLDHGLAAGRVVEVQLPVEGENLEGIEVRAVAGGRVGRQIGSLQEEIGGQRDIC